MDDIERAMWGTPVDPEVSALRKRVAVLEAGLRDTADEFERFVKDHRRDFPKRAAQSIASARALLGGVPATKEEQT